MHNKKKKNHWQESNANHQGNRRRSSPQRYARLLMRRPTLIRVFPLLDEVLQKTIIKKPATSSDYQHALLTVT